MQIYKRSENFHLIKSMTEKENPIKRYKTVKTIYSNGEKQKHHCQDLGNGNKQFNHFRTVLFFFQ